MQRRDFLKLLALTGTGLMTPGCATSPHVKFDDRLASNLARLPYHALAESLPQEQDYECRIEGRLPEDLQGSLYRNGRVESRYYPALPHQTVRAVFPHTAFRCSSLQSMRFRPTRCRRHFVQTALPIEHAATETKITGAPIFDLVPLS